MCPQNLTSFGVHLDCRLWVQLTCCRQVYRQKGFTVTKENGDMGPQKTPIAEKVDKLKKRSFFLSEDVSEVRLEQKSIQGLIEEVKALSLLNEEKDKRITYLETRVADLEQYTQVNDVIITGLKIKPR
ncbi:uncharacterized protein V6R79_024100 [Siganus canaliculatus]